MLREQPRKQFRLLHNFEPDVVTRAGIFSVLHIATGLFDRCDNFSGKTDRHSLIIFAVTQRAPEARHTCSPGRQPGDLTNPKNQSPFGGRQNVQSASLIVS